MELTPSASASAGKPAPRGKRNSILGAVVLVLVFGIVFGKVANPFERFFEVDAGMYHTLDAVLAASDSARLKRVLKDALDRDGKLTQANMASVWRAYEDALPDGFRIPAAGASDRPTERARLIDRVGAHPDRSVWTPFTGSD